ncbi:hypothetical protein BaRGS_00027448, partial [Batillaria attramentaria]
MSGHPDQKRVTVTGSSGHTETETRMIISHGRSLLSAKLNADAFSSLRTMFLSLVALTHQSDYKTLSFSIRLRPLYKARLEPSNTDPIDPSLKICIPLLRGSEERPMHQEHDIKEDGVPSQSRKRHPTKAQTETQVTLTLTDTSRGSKNCRTVVCGSCFGGVGRGNRCAMSRSRFSRSDAPQPPLLDVRPASAEDSGKDESRRQLNRLAAKDMEEAESSEKISLHPLDDFEEEEPKKELTWREKVAAFLQTNKVQWAIIGLVVLDCLIVILELLIDLDVIHIPEDAHHHHHHNTSANASDFEVAYNNHTMCEHGSSHHSRPTAGNHDKKEEGGEHEEEHGPNRELTEHVLHMASLIILTIFFVEVVFKVIAEGTHLLKHKAEVFDAIVVVVSFTMDITFSFVNVTQAAKDYAGLLVVLRLWRFTRIINGVILSVKMDADKKVNKERALRNKAEQQVQQLTDKVDQLTADNTKLRAKIKKLTGKEATTPSDVSAPIVAGGANQLETPNGDTPVDVISATSDK